MSSVSFGDLVRLKDSRVGTVRFIGRTTVKKTIYYGIQLKVKTGEHDGCMHSRRFFKCNDKYGVFVERSDIVKVIKHHTIAASYHYDQVVMVTDYGIGQIKYIGMIHTDHGLWYGVELEQCPAHSIENSEYVQNLTSNDIQKYLYFEADPNKALFVRVNMLKSVRNREFRRKAVLNGKDDSKEDVSTPKTTKTKPKKNEGYNEYINKTFIQMMDRLDIPQKSRPRMLKMDDSKKLLLIQQWFITPNHRNDTDDDELEIAKEQSISPKHSISESAGFDGLKLNKAPIDKHKRRSRKNKKMSKKHKEYKRSKKKRKMMRIVVHKASQSLIEYKKPKQLKQNPLKLKKASSDNSKSTKSTKVKSSESKETKSKKKKNNLKKSNSAGSIRQYLRNKILMDTSKSKEKLPNSLKPKLQREKSSSAALLQKKGKVKKSKSSKSLKVESKRHRKKSSSAALLQKKAKSKQVKKQNDKTLKSKRINSNSSAPLQKREKTKNKTKKTSNSLRVKPKHNKTSSAALLRKTGSMKTKKSIKKANSASSLEKYSKTKRKKTSKSELPNKTKYSKQTKSKRSKKLKTEKSRRSKKKSIR